MAVTDPSKPCRTEFISDLRDFRAILERRGRSRIFHKNFLDFLKKAWTSRT